MNLRRFFQTVSIAAIVSVSVSAQDLKPVKLSAPNLKREATLMNALNERKSVREWSDKSLSEQDLSDLLWAVNGVNRPGEKKRTYPTANNVQDLDIYLFNENGVYLHDPFANTLNPVINGDLRKEAGIQEFVGTAPAVLLIVSDLSRFKRGDDASRAKYAAMHAGSVSQNISLFCAGNGMGTVVIGMVDGEALKKRLNLKESQIVLLSHPVGYLK